MGFWRNISTGRDNTTHDTIRVIMVSVAVSSIAVMIWAMCMETYRAICSTKDYLIPFSMRDDLTAYSFYIVSVGGFLTGGGVGLKMKRQKEPDGTENSTESLRQKAAGANQSKNNIVSQDDAL